MRRLNKAEQELADLLPEPLKAKVEAREYTVQPGQNPLRPVVRNLEGKLVRGSGRYPNANDIAKTARLTGYKKSKTYREALEHLVPLEGGEEKRGSFAWWLKEAYSAAEGSPQRVECPHEECDQRHLVAFKKDGQLIFKLIELLSGKARETQDLNIKSESLIAVLNERTPVHEITVHTIDPNESIRRREIIDAT
jgi:hypothetical protein